MAETQEYLAHNFQLAALNAALPSTHNPIGDAIRRTYHFSVYAASSTTLLSCGLAFKSSSLDRQRDLSICNGVFKLIKTADQLPKATQILWFRQPYCRTTRAIAPRVGSLIQSRASRHVTSHTKSGSRTLARLLKSKAPENDQLVFPERHPKQMPPVIVSDSDKDVAIRSQES